MVPTINQLTTFYGMPRRSDVASIDAPGLARKSFVPGLPSLLLACSPLTEFGVLTDVGLAIATSVPSLPG